MGDRDRYIHLKEISVNFIKRRPTSVLEIIFKDEAGVKHKSNKFKEDDLLHWNLDTHVRAQTCATLTIQRALFKISVVRIEIEFKPNESGDYTVVGLEDRNHRVTVSFVCERFKSLADVTRVLGSQAHTNLAPSKVFRFLKLPQLAALLPPTSKRGYNVQYPAIHWLNNDILLSIFNYYRLDDEFLWNVRLLWCKLSHVCQRWRHLIYECAFHLGIHIKCSNGAPIVEMLDDLPPLPLFVDYGYTSVDVTLTEKDELGIYHALRSHDRVRHIHLGLPSSILHKAVGLMDEQFPRLEHLSLSFTDENSIPLTLPKAFLAPNLRYLALLGVGLPKRLRMLIFTDSLVTLQLSEIRESSYFRPRLLVARLRSLPHLEDFYISFSIPIPRPSTERELLGEQGAPVTLPGLKILRFRGVSAYLESLIAQIRVPLLEQLDITLFNQIAFGLPHLSYFISHTEGLKLPEAEIYFYRDNVCITTTPHSKPHGLLPFQKIFLLRVLCKELDWQIDCAAQICNAIIPAVSSVEKLRLYGYFKKIPTEWQNGAIDDTTWHELLRSFVEVKELRIDNGLLEELSRALQMDEVLGVDPGFLPNLQTITGRENPFSLFIDTRQVVGRPVQFLRWLSPWP